MRAGDEDRPMLIASDVDGCLLDEQTYSWQAAAAALAALRERRVPLVLCSSKTRAEMELLACEMGLCWPYVVENGGAVVIPTGHLPPPPGARVEGAFAVLEMGTAREVLVAQLREIALETGATILGFSSLSATDVARLTGLPEDRAARALQRRYDEPFLLEGSEEAVSAAAARRQLEVTRGARFLHLTGAADKGIALARLLEAYEAAGRRFTTVGLGDAPNDLPLLRAVDRPILVPRPRGVDPRLAAAFPDAERAPAPGPAGWGRAVLAVVR